MKNPILITIVLGIIGSTLVILSWPTNSTKPLPKASLPDQKKSVTRQLHITILPFGDFPEQKVSAVRSGIKELYGDVKITVLASKKLPEQAYYPPRKRYRAEKLLDYLDTQLTDKNGKILGLTTVDISTTKGKYPDWGIFGLGRMGGEACVVSTFRLKRKASDKLLLERLTKVVNHELGHTLGLPHCPTKRCLMEDAKGTIKTVDNETGIFCNSCKMKLKKK